MNVTIKGSGSTHSLNKNDFVASGGEGQIFRKGGVAFKIYSDPKKMIPVAKIDELSVLTDSNIIRPQHVLLDSHNHAVGYTMRFVKDTFVLSQLFPKAFRDRYRIKAGGMLKLVRKLQDIVAHCHDKHVLIVDVNELNFLVDDAFSDVFAIDCDSYKTKNFPATAIMDSIRDRHASGHNNHYNASQGTDWFSFGILSFQMFIGIHPFRGKHPVLKTMDDRMLKNVSVLNDHVSFPAVCQPFTDVPSAYMEWYKAIFEQGKRIAPPDSPQAAATVAPKIVKIKGSNNFVIRKLLDLAEEIIRFDPATRFAITSEGVFNESGKLVYKLTASGSSSLGMTPKGRSVLALVENGLLRLVDVMHQSSAINTGGVDIACQAVMAYAGRLYLKNNENILEIEFVEGNSIFAGPTVVASVLSNATRMFDGIVIQDLLGACYITVFPESKTAYSIHVSEFDGKKIIDAKFDHRVAMFLVYNFQDGRYDKVLLRLGEDFSDYEVMRTDRNVGPVGLNFVTLDSGVCVHLNELDELEVFRAKKGAKDLRVFSDPALSGDMTMFKSGTQAMFGLGTQLFAFEVKKP